jgi:2'-5' RNA ligase
MSERLFVSIDLPDALTEGIAAAQEPITDASGMRPTDPAQAHVTLAFLGDTPAEEVPSVETALEDGVAAADVAPFEATYGGLGAFPSESYISVVWVGVHSGGEAMTQLHTAIVEALETAGYSVDTHDSFTPHVTIARMDHAGGKERVQRVLREHDPTVDAATVETVHLKRSVLTDHGPEYETIASVPLS